MKIVSSIASVGAALALSALPVQADLVNGNFNTGDLSSWWIYAPDTANSSISVLSGSGDAFSYDGSAYAYQMAHNATSDPLLGQDISVAGGAQYTVSLMYRANNWGGAGVSIAYFDSSWTKLSEYQWAGLYTGTGADTGWTSFTSSLWTAPTSAAFLEVKLDAWGWSDTFYDNVSVNVVPEPGVGTLLGLGGLLLIRIRNARARR